jgi:hypothetical protein
VLQGQGLLMRGSDGWKGKFVSSFLAHVPACASMYTSTSAFRLIHGQIQGCDSRMCCIKVCIVCCACMRCMLYACIPHTCVRMVARAMVARADIGCALHVVCVCGVCVCVCVWCALVAPFVRAAASLCGARV